MNSEEGMSMAKMAVAILLVVLLIGAVVGIVYAAYSWFGSGQDKLADNVTSIADTALSNYDDNVVSGDDVLAALKNFRNSDYCVIISNLRNQGGTFTQLPNGNIAAYNYCAVATGATADNASGGAMSLNIGRQDIGTTGQQWCIQSLATVNGNAAATSRNTNFTPTTTKSYANTFVKKTGQWYANLVYDQSTGDICGVIFRQMG